MGIIREKNPRTKKEEVYLEGVVEGVYLNELKTIRSYTNPRTGAEWTPTHGIRMIIDKVGINLGLTDKQLPLRAKDSEEQYQDIEVGAVVNVLVSKEDEYNGKPQYEGRLSDILIQEVAPAKQSAPAQSKGGYGGGKKRDNLPIRLGNAITAASNLASKAKKTPDFGDILTKATKILAVVDETNAALKKEYPDMDEYSLGSRLGQCVSVATSLYGTNVDTLQEVITDMFTSISETEAEVREAQKADKKPAKKEAEPEVEAEDQPEEKEDEPEVEEKPKGKTRSKPTKPEPEPEVEEFEDDDLPF